MIGLFKHLLHHYYYNLKLRSKLMISHTIPFLVPTAVLAGFLFMQMYTIIQDDAIRSEQALASQTAISVRNLISRVSHSADTLTASSAVKGLFQTSRSDAGKETISASWLDSLFFLAESLMEPSLITSIQIYYDEEAYGDLTRYNEGHRPLFEPFSLVENSPWYQLMEGDEREQLLCPSAYLSPGEGPADDSLAFITRVSYLTQERDGQPEGTSAFIALYFPEQALTQMLGASSAYANDISYLVNEQNLVAASTDSQAAARYAQSPDRLRKLAGEPGAMSLISHPDGALYVTCFEIPDTDWYLVSVIPQQQIKESGRTILYRFAALYGGFSLLALITAIVLSVSIADRITRVARQMETVRTGRPQPLEEKDTGCDEIGVLADTYNYMTQEINDLLDGQKAAAEELAKADFRALQAQINPHFLYNTLDMINWLAQDGQPHKVTRAVQALSRFYKLTLGRRELTYRIRDDLAHVSLYMELQNMRYDHCAEFILDVPGELKDYQIPKLTFQPIVENALLHGIMMKDKKEGSILLTGWKSGDVITFIISDDGAGIPPDKLDTLLEETPASQYEPSSRHIGVYNTNMRLKRLYGEEYGLSFQSELGVGTEVTILMPAIKDEETD